MLPTIPLKAGYEPAALVRFFEKQQAKGIAAVGKSFLTHPAAAERLALDKANVEKLPPLQQPITPTPEFAEIKRLVANLK